MKVIFSHGKESGPWGSKITALANTAKKQGFDADSIDYSGINDPDERVSVLVNYLQKETQSYVLVGSSMGGYVSLVCAKTHPPKGVFLLAPALYMPNYAQQDYKAQVEHISIVHGWSDTVVPVSHSIKYAQQQHCDLHLIAGDHRLNSSMASVTSLFTDFLERVKNY